MAQFLRDENISNLTIDRDSLIQIASVFENRAQALEKLLRNNNNNESVFRFYVIRFDNKGYRVFTTPELLRYFDQAKEVERIIVTVQSAESVSSNRLAGAHLELRIDERDPTHSYLSVTSDDTDWVDVSFSAVHENINKYKNRNSWVRTEWMNLLIQLGGVFLGFVLSLWAAVAVSPQLNIQNSFVISVLFALLIFSNTWVYFKGVIIRGVNKYFPNIKFYRPTKDRMHWLIQTIIGGITLAIALYLLNLGFTFLGEFLGGLTKDGL